MKLYLASYAMVSMAKIIKHEGRDFVGKKAIFIPTAGDPYDIKDFVEADRIALEKYGLDIVEMDIKNKNVEEIRKAIVGADIVLVAGGDTFYLMEKLKESGADKVIKDFIEKNGIYIGSSAGSIICCPTIEGAEEFDNPNLAKGLNDFDGMGVFKDVIIPHVQKEKYFERIRRATERLESKGFKVYPLTDDDVLFFDGHSYIIL
ncbi:Type 1 glutamine amidotransferase-like domain-containing protein [Candidatus Saccharibacteria bacterium]|nr:Type 1 glutamine amidotransferase-like domain-containing protein [Candidatus Saccharibacteria bacterium]